MQQLIHSIFVADDDEDDHYLLQTAFQAHCPACQLQFANDGLKLLDLLSSHILSPSLIILDLNMPRLDGFETLQILRHNPLYTQTPIVILTTSDNQSDRRQAFELQASEFVTKPLSQHGLVHLVQQLKQTWLQ
ncbi:response regulator [Spirosoma sp. KUDC1026]|uniref:response regulator n=1 Tax=Spirosoma sp. KUDC1026 TaxID=2745947 RepID=UPI00159BD7CA|nr:response regulator [Spirosoma sp. KUDC1026]QKZ12922.1 response regulator [Spirosoma sp. KUDC1026]